MLLAAYPAAYAQAQDAQDQAAAEQGEEMMMEEVIVTDSIPLTAEAEATGRFRVLSVASLLGEAIKRIHHSDSVSSLFV